MTGYISILVATTQLFEQISAQKQTDNNYRNFHYASPQSSKCVRAELSFKIAKCGLYRYQFGRLLDSYLQTFMNNLAMDSVQERMTNHKRLESLMNHPIG